MAFISSLFNDAVSNFFVYSVVVLKNSLRLGAENGISGRNALLSIVIFTLAENI
jgi:hypothetical protein